MPNWKNRITRTGMIDPKTLIPNPDNYRDHSESQRISMSGLLDTLGWVDGIHVNENTGHILDGHMRVEEAIKNGESEVPVIYLDVTEEEEQTILATYDPITFMASENKKKLRAIIENPVIQGAIAIELLKSIADRNKINIKSLEEGNGEGEEDNDDNVDQNSTQSEPIKDEFSDVQVGDIYQVVGKSTVNVHKMMCGDVRVEDNVRKLLLAEKINTIVTSPPYNQGLNTYKPTGMQKEGKFVDRMAGAYTDDLPEDVYQQQQIDLLDMLCSYMMINGSIFYNHKIRYRDKEIVSPTDWLRKLRIAKIRQEIIWDRSSSITLNARMFIPADERIYWLRVGDDFRFNDEEEIKSWTNIWEIAGKNEVGTTVAFPVEIPTRCIRATTGLGDRVFDPYGGSGTTILACENTGRAGFSMEISPIHFAESLRRLRDEGMRLIKL